ncbi:MAG: class I SAM-dependent methyltransferase, partial [Deltaproteobacteria bacterium]|nr:class I SAM-dependent methyltransferase [Deltaproteobacteria bacterium]
KRTFSMPDGTKVKYIWDHDDFNPITNAASFYIHYKFRGKPIFERVFEYHWRMWSISEMRDCLLEAGFDDVKVYWEEDDEETDEGSGYFSEHEDADDCPVWIAYMVGIKK